MIVQFFRYGNGMSKGPLDYLLGKDRDRDHARLLSGSEQEVARLIDSSPFAKKYTAGCLSFYETDLDQSAKEKIMADFEKCLFPGLDQSQYRVLWIEHKDKVNQETGECRLELNFVIPNTEILTGQRLQPFYHKADMSRVDLFKKVTNFEYGLHDPDDPLFRQDITTKKSLPKKVADIKTVIDTEAQNAIEKGMITDRASMKKWLMDLGLEISKETKKSISVLYPHDDKKPYPIRLTGAIYEQNFRLTEESAGLTRAASERFRREARERHEADLQRYREHLERKGAELAAKYLRHEARLGESTEQSYSRDHAADTGQRQDCEKSAGHDFASSPDRPEAGTGEPASELARVHPLEQRNSTAIQFKNGPYFIKYTLDFSSTYRLYQHHFDDIRRDEQVQRDPSQRSASTADRASHRGKNLGIQEVAERHLRDQKQQREEINDVGIAAIRDYRAATAAAQRATEAARASLAAVAGAAESLESASASYRRARSIHSDLESETQRGLADSEAVSADRAAAIRADHLAAFFRGLTAAVSKRFKSACDEVASVFGLAGADKSLSARASAEADASRAREADPSFSAEAGSETRLGLQLSRAFKGFSSEPIRKAAVVLAQRKEAAAAKEKARDNEGPSLGW